MKPEGPAPKSVRVRLTAVISFFKHNGVVFPDIESPAAEVITPSRALTAGRVAEQEAGKFYNLKPLENPADLRKSELSMLRAPEGSFHGQRLSRPWTV